MIVKVQLPLISNDGAAPALIYNKGKSVWIMRYLEELPPHVLALTKRPDQKGFFFAKIEGDVLVIGDEAPWQEW